MRAIIVGAGPTGLFTAMALARRGHDVVLVDRDPGPPASGTWQRKGVMQFHHAHTLRGPVVEALRAEMPDVLEMRR
jgi:2-polyprenyl-6-methoxyphenol hydroxylase-like FAD-dependent oxidoreductase